VRRAARGALVALAGAAVLVLATSGCAYTVSTGIPSHIRTVAVPAFANASVQYTLGQELADAVIDRFVRDNHLRVVSQREANSVIEGKVLEYRNDVFGYNTSAQAQEYRVGVRVEVRFKDLVKNRDLWNDVLIKTENYSAVATPGRPAVTEDQARQDLVGKVADEVLSRTVSRW
jgi:hypothetical protein